MKFLIAILCLVASLTAFGQVQIEHVERLPHSDGVGGCHLSQWCWEHDPDTAGISSGTSRLSGSLRRFDVVWKHFGGERFHIGPAQKDSASTSFTIDTWIYFNKLS